MEELLCPYVEGIVPNDNPRHPLPSMEAIRVAGTVEALAQVM